MQYTAIDLQKINNIAVIKMTRPEILNPLDITAGKEINKALDIIENDHDVRTLVVTGSGKAFSAGGDIKGMHDSIEKKQADTFMDELTHELYTIADRLRKLSIPVIASVNGVAVGAGMNLALCCDIVLASEKAVFSQSFIKLGLIPGFGGTHLLINQLTWQKASEIAFLGNNITSNEMLSLGLVNIIYPDELLEQETLNFAEKLSKGPALAYARTKKLFLDALGSNFSEHIEKERKMQIKSTLSDDYATGVSALINKTTPSYKGR